ncbi:hypothetical protein [Tropicibacter alexandrii]|uniref:hypothetical protein n=1 Tax=Tropicibacter alexandrii TaxID=2267683 RepID=UPI001008C357|nr:hypothetical protein [Tropicibacter alexandrii]
MATVHRGTGVTDSERYLQKIAERTFLDLWCYPNIYSDKRGHKSGDGKEICDLLVTFGDDVLIFSDKYIEWKPHEDIEVSWKRWYKSAVQKSAQQIRGAERWLTEFPDRVFTDKDCKHRLPIALPPANARRVHGIAVAIGAEDAAKQHRDDEKGTFFLSPEIKGDAHAPKDGSNCMPFFIGDIAPDGTFIHVFDRTSLDTVLDELDTVSDFVSYLRHREQAFRQPLILLANSELDLLACYFETEDENGNHSFCPPDHETGDLYAIPPGRHKRFVSRPEYLARKVANQDSYAWDKLISIFAQTLLSGTAISPPGQEESPMAMEVALRKMAAEDRTRRRSLSAGFMDALERTKHLPDARYSRVIYPDYDAPDPFCAYVFLFLPIPGNFPDNASYEEYRTARNKLLEIYSYATLRHNKTLKRVVGIGMEGLGGKFHPNGSSEDLLILEVDQWTEELEQEVKDAEEYFGIMRKERLNWSNITTQEFPDYSKPSHTTRTKMSRQQRRAMERTRNKRLRKRRD